MSILNKATTGRRGRAQKVVIYTPEGFGKSTLASLFPDPLSFDVEDSTSQLDVRRLGRDAIPDLKTFESALAEVAKVRPCASLSVDTIDWLEEMAALEICAEHKVSNLEEVSGGYGKGYSYLTNRMSVTLAKLDAVIAAGIHVVLLAHCSIVRFDPPDGAGAFDRYELKLYKDRKGGKGTASLIKEWADMLVFGNWRVQIAEKGKGDKTTYKGVGGRERLLFCNRTAAWDAKNRHGLADVEKWGDSAADAVKVFERAFKSVGAPWGNAPAPVESAAPAVAPPVAPEPEAKPAFTDTSSLVTTADLDNPIELPAPGVKDDEIPGIVNPPIVAPEVDTELTRICSKDGDAITAYLRERGKITPGQTWQHVSADFAAKVKKNPAGFLKVALAGKAVAA